MRLLLCLAVFVSVGAGVLSNKIDCDFSSSCCWATVNPEQRWDVRDRINLNEFRRTFLVGRSKPPPTGNYLMRVETSDSGSAFQSCPFCTLEPAIHVTYRHWQSPTARLELCYKLAHDEIDISHCVQIHSTRQSQMVEQRINVPVGKNIKLFFLLENTVSESHAVVIVDRIRVEYKPCNAHTPTTNQYHAVSRTASLSTDHHDQSELDISKNTTRRGKETKEVKITFGQREPFNVDPTNSGQGIQKLQIKKLGRKEQLLNAQIEQQIKDINEAEADEVYRVELNEVQIVKANDVRTHRRRIPKKPEPIVSEDPTQSTAVLEPSLQQITQPTTTPTNQRKGFNPLYDLVGEDVAKFLDPNYVTAEDDIDDPETEEFLKEQKSGASLPSNNQKSPTPSTPPPSTFSMKTVAPQYELVNYVDPQPLKALEQPEVCDLAGGCLFDRSFCGYSQPYGTTTGRFQLRKVGVTSIAQATVEPGESSVLETNTFLKKNYMIHFDVLEFSDNFRVLGCCSSDLSPTLKCPFATPLEGGLVIWHQTKFLCPAQTAKITFICENKGNVSANCAIDNVRLHSPNDILLLEPCQRTILPYL